MYNCALNHRLKTRITDEVLHKEATRARQMSANRLDMQAFAQYLNQPMTEAVQDIFSLFQEVELVFSDTCL